MGAHAVDYEPRSDRLQRRRDGVLEHEFHDDRRAKAHKDGLAKPNLPQIARPLVTNMAPTGGLSARRASRASHPQGTDGRGSAAVAVEGDLDGRLAAVRLGERRRTPQSRQYLLRVRHYPTKVA